MDEQRRVVLGVGAAAAVAAALPSRAAPQKAAPPALDPMPPLPASLTPGHAGEFDFLSGEWRIQNWSIVNDEWLAYEGEASVYGILAGIGSVEELRIPSRNFSGMGLRMLDVERRVWSDFWVNARSGVLTTPGQIGSFERGAGIFSSEDVDNGRPVIYAGVWDKITPTSCRWRQASSRDGGKTWVQTWIMHWTRV